MKNKLIILVGLSMLLSTWWALVHASHAYAGEVASLKTVTLRIEGMT